MSLFTKEYKELGLSIPKGWRRLRHGEKFGLNYRYCYNNSNNKKFVLDVRPSEYQNMRYRKNYDAIFIIPKT